MKKQLSFIAALLCAVMLLGMLPASAYALDSMPDAGNITETDDATFTFTDSEDIDQLIAIAQADPETQYNCIYEGTDPLILKNHHIPLNMWINALSTDVLFSEGCSATVDGIISCQSVYVKGNVTIGIFPELGRFGVIKFQDSLDVTGHLTVNGRFVMENGLDPKILGEENITYGPNSDINISVSVRTPEELMEVLQFLEGRPDNWRAFITVWEPFELSQSITIPKESFLTLHADLTIHGDLVNDGYILVNSAALSLMGRVTNKRHINVTPDFGAMLLVSNPQSYTDTFENGGRGCIQVQTSTPEFPYDAIQGLLVNNFQDITSGSYNPESYWWALRNYVPGNVPHQHTPVEDPAVAPDCLNYGFTQGSHCSGCGQVLVPQEQLAPLGHMYSDPYDESCDVCGAKRVVNQARPTVSMYRMYNPNSGEHFYTGSMEERTMLVEAGWKYEGVGFTFPYNTGAPVFRLYDRNNTKEHLYTMDPAEMAALLAQGWEYEGIAFNSGYDTEVPQYRLHNPNATIGAYHFTASEAEKDSLIAAGWEYQGIGWYSCWQ